MSKIGIISDTHGYVEVIDEILEATKDWGLSLWLHGGDFGDDARYMAERTSIPVKMVKGNNDRRKPLAPEIELLEYEDTYIFMTHGDKFMPFQQVGELRFIARHYGAKLIVLGHTHRHESYEIVKGTLVVNPGSPVLPRDGTKGTFAVATFTEGQWMATFYAMDKIRKNSIKK